MKFLTTSFEEVGVQWLFANPQQLEQLVAYLTYHFYSAPDKPNRKVSVKLLKQIYLGLNLVPKEITDLLLTKKQKLTYQPRGNLQFDPSKLNYQLIEFALKNAFVFHQDKSLDSLQVAK